MRLTFKRIEIHNFLSFLDETFDFDKINGLNLICGKNNDIPGSKNGCGKSAIMETICFALFGQTRNNLKNGNIANKYSGSKEVRVVLTFDVDNNQYKVASGFNKYGGPYCKLEQIENGELIDLTKSSIIETRKFIESEIIHCDISIFLRTILLSSDQQYNFYTLSKFEKKIFIEKLFDISAFGKIYDKIHRDVLNLDKEIVGNQNTLVTLNKANSEYKERIEKYELTKKENIKQLNNKKVELEKQLDDVKSKNIKSNSEEVEKYEQALNKLNDGIRKIQDKLRKLNKDISSTDVKIHKLNTSKEQKQKIIDKHSELLQKLCNDCKKIFADYYSITQYREEIQEINKKVEVLNQQKIEFDNSQKELNTKQDSIQQMIDKINIKIQKLTEEYNKAQKQLLLIESQIYSAETDIVKVEKQKNPYEELYENNTQELLNEQQKLDNLSEKYKYLKFAENIVSQDTLRKLIISDLVWLLNNKIKMYLTKFGAKYSVEFDSNMNYEFITEAGSYEYANFSAGERARLMIATCFAFRDFMYIRNNLSSNILILDEFIDGAIDDLAIDSILSIMKEFSQLWKQNIFVISHRKEINNDVFNNIIQIVKTNNISKITYVE